MDDQFIERKLNAIRDIKQFARSEMARDLGRRHGKAIRLPWDAEAPQLDAQQPTEDLDSEALSALEGLAGGN